jgi:RNA polymerase-binding transcription factor DksA
MTVPLDTQMTAARAVLEARRASLRVLPSSTDIALELGELDAALARIELGTWGRCERCSSAIGRLRLRAMPEARLCLECSNQT